MNVEQESNERSVVVAGLIAFSFLAFIYLYWSWTDQLVGFGGDNAFYVLTAQKFSPYSHQTSAAANYFTAHSQFPPLYPLLLALFDGGYNLLAAHQATTWCLLLAFVLLFIWARQLELPAVTALMVVFSFAILPGTYSQTLYLHSENLYLLFTLLFLILASNEHNLIQFPYATAIVVAATALTRTAGIALIVTYLIVLVTHRQRGWVCQAAVAIVPVVIWNVYDYSLGNHYVNSLGLGSNTSALSAVLERIKTQFVALEYGWLTNLTTSDRLATQAYVFGALCLTGTVWRLIRLRVDAIYITSYLFLLLLWPFPSEAARFIFVIVPLLLTHGALLVHDLMRGFLNVSFARHGGMLFPAIAFLIAIPDLVFATQRFQMELPNSLEKYRRDPWSLVGTESDALISAYTIDSTIRAAKSLGEDAANKDCILAIKPSIVGYFSGRISQAPPVSSLSSEEFNASVNRIGCHYLLLLNMASPSFNSPMYPLSRLKDRIEILQTYHLADDASAQVVAQTGKLK